MTSRYVIRGHAHGHDHAHTHGHDHAHTHGHDHAHGHGHDHPHPHDAEPPSPREPLAREPGRVLFLDCFSGVAGDMLVAALLDLGVSQDLVREAVASIPLDGYRIGLARVERSGIAALKLVVDVHAPQPERTYADIRALLDAASLPPGARALAHRAFRILAEAESTIHGTTLDAVHFHEVGAVDSIVDVVAAAVALDAIGADVVASPLPMGRGFIRARHGILPIPAPATVLALRGVPTEAAAVDAELVTPTGACLVRAAASSFSRWPDIIPERIGWGAGTRELPDRPNLLRAVLGRPSAASRPTQGAANEHESPFVLLEANIDDSTPEVLAFTLERVLAEGALDAFTMPIGMKKGRAATMLCVLCRRATHEALARVVLRETSTLGLRVRPVERIERPRRFVDVETVYGLLRVKVADGDGLPTHAAPEYEPCRAAALAHSVPLRDVMRAALEAYFARAEQG